MPSKVFIEPYNWRLRMPGGKRISFPRLRLLGEVEGESSVSYLSPDLLQLSRRISLRRGEITVVHSYLESLQGEVVEHYEIRTFGRASFAKFVFLPDSDVVEIVSEKFERVCQCLRTLGRNGWQFYYVEFDKLSEVVGDLQPHKELLPGGNSRMWRRSILSSRMKRAISARAMTRQLWRSK